MKKIIFLIFSFFTLVACQDLHKEEVRDSYPENKINLENIDIEYFENGGIKYYFVNSKLGKDCISQGIWFNEDGSIDEVMVNQRCFAEKDSSSEDFGSTIYFSEKVKVNELGRIETLEIDGESVYQIQK